MKAKEPTTQTAPTTDPAFTDPPAPPMPNVSPGISRLVAAPPQLVPHQTYCDETPAKPRPLTLLELRALRERLAMASLTGLRAAKMMTTPGVIWTAEDVALQARRDADALILELTK